MGSGDVSECVSCVNNEIPWALEPIPKFYSNLDQKMILKQTSCKVLDYYNNSQRTLVDLSVGINMPIIDWWWGLWRKALFCYFDRRTSIFE